MKKILILLLLITRPNYAGSLLSKYFKSKSKPKVELTNSSQIEDEVNINIQEQNTQERNRLLAKYLFLDSSEINVLKVLEPLKVEKLEISPEEATEKLKNLYNLYHRTDEWYKFRQEAATLINSGADPNTDNKYSIKERSLLNTAVSYQDYFFVYFLLKRGSKINQYTLTNAKTLKMTELLISYGANPRETRWFRGDPLLNVVIECCDSKLICFYVNEFKYQANTKYVGGNLLHVILKHPPEKQAKEKIKTLLFLGVSPFEKNDLGETSIDKAKEFLNTEFQGVREFGRNFLECIEEYNQTFKETLIEQTKEILPLELQDYIYKFHAGEDAELFAPKDS